MPGEYSGLFDDEENVSESTPEKEESLEENELNEDMLKSINKARKEIEEEEALSDIDNYFTLDEQLKMAAEGIMLTTAKEYKIETGKNPLKEDVQTKVFVEWLKKKRGIEEKTPREQKTELTPDIIKQKLKESKMTTKEKKKPDKIEDSLFGFDDDDEIVKEKPKPVVKEKPEEKLKSVTVKKDDDDDDDIFGFEEKKPVIKQSSVETKDILFNMDNYPVIILLWGYDGTSKSEQIMKFVDKKGRRPLIFDFENKLRPLAIKMGFPQENIITSGKYNEKYQIDGPVTLKDFRILLDEIKIRIHKNPENRDFSALALDGISDIRPFAKDEWLLENKGRKQPVNPGDWSEINDKVRDVVFTMINIGRAEDINIFLTAQVGGKWENNVKIEDAPDCKDWIWHNVDHKFRLYKDMDFKKFFAECEKSFYDPFWIIDLTDFTHREKPSLMNILQDPKLIEKYREEYKLIKKEILERAKTGNLF